MSHESRAEHPRFAEISVSDLRLFPATRMASHRVKLPFWLCDGSSAKPWRDSKPVQVPETRRFGKRILTSAGQGGCCGVVDEIVFGVDLDGSNQRVQDVRSSRAYAGARGLTTHELERKSNCASLACRPAGVRRVDQYCEADSVIFPGRDTDGSDALPRPSVRQQAVYAGARVGGLTSFELQRRLAHERCDAAHRAAGKPRFGQGSQVDSIVFGRDHDRSDDAVAPPIRAMPAYSDAHGLTSAELRRPRAGRRAVPEGYIGS